MSEATAAQSRALAHYVPMAREAELHATIERMHLQLCEARREVRLLKSEDPAQLVRWSSLPSIVRGLGMPQATEDLQALLGALSHIVGERGYDNAEELLESLDIAAECVEELRMPEPLSEREQAEADAMDRAERRFEEARDGL